MLQGLWVSDFSILETGVKLSLIWQWVENPMVIFFFTILLATAPGLSTYNLDRLHLTYLGIKDLQYA